MKHSQNIPGPWYCDPDDDDGEGCIACNVCYTGAPDFFAEDEDGNAYVKKQPRVRRGYRALPRATRCLSRCFDWS